MDEQNPLRKAVSRAQEVINTYIKQEQSAHTESTPAESVATEGEAAAPAAESAPQEPDVAMLQQRISELEQQLAALQQERDQLREKYLRTLAEMENFRKRLEREKEQAVLIATERLFARLVELLDDLVAALNAAKQHRDYEALLKGLEMITTKAHKLYEEHGVRPLEVAPGEPFDVERHEALAHVPHPELPEGVVLQQVSRGYLFRDRVLRHARVITSAGVQGADGSPQSSEGSPQGSQQSE